MDNHLVVARDIALPDRTLTQETVVEPHATDESSASVHSRSASEASSSEDDSYQGSLGDHPYDIDELAAIITDFYKFLATLHYDPADLKLPPPQGWDAATLPNDIVETKSKDVIELMKHLPYFAVNDTPVHCHQQCKLVDYTDHFDHSNARIADELLDDLCDNFSLGPDESCDRSHLLVIAWGYGNGGTQWILDVSRGQIIEDVIPTWYCDPVDIKEFFDQLKHKFSSLVHIPCPGRETLLDTTEPPQMVAITEDQVRTQTENWGTELDLQFVRQVYRQHGWPNDFRRTEAVRFLEEFMAHDEERRGEWSTVEH